MCTMANIWWKFEGSWSTEYTKVLANVNRSWGTMDMILGVIRVNAGIGQRCSENT